MSMPSPQVIDVLVANHRRFSAFLEGRVGRAEDAEDILQDAFLKSVAKGSTLRENESVVAWFYRVLRNTLADHYRHRAAEGRVARRVMSFSPGAEKPDPAVERTICQCVRELLPTLRGDYAILLRRVDLEDEGIADVASDTGLTPNNIRVRLHRARKALRKQLEVSCGICADHGCLDCTCKHRPHHDHATHDHRP
jgi:RNA polymerase sigma factor (sigma-70 family)